MQESETHDPGQGLVCQYSKPSDSERGLGKLSDKSTVRFCFPAIEAEGIFLW